MDRCLIVSGGEYSPLEYADRYEYVVACDRGYENCLRMGIIPDLVVGDFDSFEGDIGDGVEIRRLNPIKDDTDTLSAARYVLNKGYRKIDICCSFGGRFDHSLANLQTAAFIVEQGGFPRLFGKGIEVVCIKGGAINISQKEGCYLSVFALSEFCEAVSIKGTKYEIEEQRLTNTFPLGVSNEWKEEYAHISVRRGTLAIMISENVSLSAL